MENIIITSIIGDVYGVVAEDGQEVYELIVKAFKDKKKVNLSFRNIKILTTDFLSTAVGQLYKDFSEEYIRENLKVSETFDLGKIALKRVVETAKLYYKDPEALRRSIDELEKENEKC
jgi:hypothetical protein